MFPVHPGYPYIDESGACRPTAMKDPVEVLRRKEEELQRLQEEVDALRLVGRLLREQTLAGKEDPQSRGKILQMP